jgi:hypothetical protein
MITPSSAQAFAQLFFGTVALVAVCLAVVAWRRSGQPLYLLVLLGGAIASFNEPVLDILGLVWYPTPGQNVAFTAFDRSIPMWVVVSYMSYYGVLACLTLIFLKRSPTLRQFAMLEVAVLVVDCILEPLFLSTGLYTYYGAQAVTIFGLPIVWPFINSLAVSLIAVALHLGAKWFVGWRVCLIPLVPPALQMLAGTTGLPAFAALSSSHAGAASVLPAMVTVVLVLAIAYAQLELVFTNTASRLGLDTPAPVAASAEVEKC